MPKMKKPELRFNWQYFMLTIKWLNNELQKELQKKSHVEQLAEVFAASFAIGYAVGPDHYFFAAIGPV